MKNFNVHLNETSMKQLPYGLQTTEEHVHEARKWCFHTFGKRWEAVGQRDGTWTVFWLGLQSRKNVDENYQWWFETDEQRVLFALRWL